MPTYRIHSALQWNTGLPEDVTTNIWHIQCADIDFDGDVVKAAWKEMMDVWSGLLSPVVAQNGHIIKAYALADPEPRAPVYEDTWNLASAPSGTPLPSEVALVLSYQAARVSGTDQARRRGRMYFGPFDTTINVNGCPDTTLYSTLLGAFLGLVSDLATATMQFAIWSRVNSAAYLPVEAWMDNAFDTQRRRGLTPTSRTTLDLV